ncbi:c-type cytochrome [Catenovulum sediminis]|uniref:Cytochrome c n=1 Tax=Catenovulum sediminis TaxID=1740262 RepID=A0ABV1RLF2_9ALTE
MDQNTDKPSAIFNIIPIFTALTLFLLLSGATQASSVDEEIRHYAQSEEALKAGQKLYETVCAACHANDLSGGAGFNLKDEEWIHGSAPSQILDNVSTGFMNAGMPGFGAMFPEKKLKQVVAYVLSKRQGLDNLTYKIYPIETKQEIHEYQFSENSPISKSGKVPNNLIDFSLPEVQNYVIEFEGDLYTPNDEQTNLHAMTYRNHRTELFIDGEKIETSEDKWERRVWPLKKGKQHFKMRYYRINLKNNFNSRVRIFVANDDLTQKIYGISVSGKQFLNNATVPIKAEDQTKIQRKKVLGLPTSSISVGFVEKINAAFNSKTCTVVGAWSGDFMNIGPNIEGRARDGSIILGDWLFNFPQQIAPLKRSDCKFEQYNLKQKTVEFTYRINNSRVKLNMSASSPNTLILDFTLLSGSLNDAQLTKWQLPKSDALVITSINGTITNHQLTLPKNTQSWQLNLQKKVK